MSKSSAIAKPAKQARSVSRAQQPAAVVAALEEIKQLTPKSAKAEQAIELLKSWLNDGTGYDEKTWPKLKTALDQQRAKVGARRLFDE